jgi:pimeloyl-ACP methyl ester carboxylesterase
MNEAPKRWLLGVAAPRVLHRVSGVDLAVHDSAPDSELPVLICLHAIAHGGGDFIGLESALVGQRRVISVDWPGQGYSGPDTQPASAARYAVLLAELADVLALKTFAILGNSIGGAAAVRYAADHPERVTALILANPGGFDPGGSSFFGKLYIGNLIAHFEQGVRQEARFERWFGTYYADILREPAAAERRSAIVAAGYENAKALVEAWESFRDKSADLTPLLSRVRAPVLVTWAKQDEIVKWERNRAGIERLPQAKVVFFEGGHSAFLESPDAFQAELTRFLLE